MTAFKIFLSNLLCRYTVKSSTKRISKHRFNQLNLTKNFVHTLLGGIYVLVILNLLECEVQLFVSLCSHFRCQSSATFGLHIANPFQAVRSILFLFWLITCIFMGVFLYFAGPPCQITFLMIFP